MNNQTKTKYLLEIFAFAFVFAVSALPVLASEISVSNIIELTNEARKAQGLSNLVQNEKLTDVAEGKLNDMIENSYFAHTSLEGLNPWYWFEKIGYDYQYAGENLAINFLTAENQNKAHRKNILNPKYQEIGVAVGVGEIDGQASIIAVQEFGARVGVVDLSEDKNFSSGKDSNLIKEEGRLVPQVLSVKNDGGVNVSPKNQGSQNIWTEKLATIDFTLSLSMLLLVASMTLIPLAFLSVAAEKIFILWESRKEEKKVINKVINIVG